MNTLGLTGHEAFDIIELSELKPGGAVQVRAEKEDGSVTEFEALARIDTPIELDYYHNGGILHTVLRQMLQDS